MNVEYALTCIRFERTTLNFLGARFGGEIHLYMLSKNAPFGIF